MARPFRILLVLPAGALLLGGAAFAQTPPAQPEPQMFNVELPPPGEMPDTTPLPPGAEDDIFFVRSGGPGTAAPMAMPPGPLTPDQEKQALEFLRQESPDLIPSLQALQKTQPERYRGELRQALRVQQALQRLQQRDPEHSEELRRERALERQSRDLVRRYKQATQAQEKTALSTDLNGVLDELFELRERHREVMIEHLEKELQTLKQTTEKRRQNKDRILQNRMVELLGADEDLRW